MYFILILFSNRYLNLRIKMIAKWIWVPYGILVIVIAWYTKWVIPDYLSSYSMWYSSYEDYSILEYALIFGVFGGIITGLAADILNQRVWLIIASILALVSYWLVPYFDGSSRDKHKEWHYYVLLVLMFMAGQSASLATISTVKINLKNFNVTVAPLIISILLSYFYMGIHIESSIRWSLLFGIDTKVYLLGVGIASFVIYAVGAIILTFDQGAEQHSIESQYYLAMLDKIGWSIFIIYEVFLMLLLMLFKLILKNVYGNHTSLILIAYTYLVYIFKCFIVNLIKSR